MSSSPIVVAVGKREADDNMKPECVKSSGYDPIKNEETDDEDMCNDTDRSSSHENHLPINIKVKEEAIKVEVKTEDDISTDDERSPEYVISSSTAGKSEETDHEDTDEDTNTSNEQHLPIKTKAEAMTAEEEISTDDEYDNEMKEPVNPPAQLSASTQEDVAIQHTTKKKRRYSKRKREVEESNGSVQKAAHTECSFEGCKRKAADSGTCQVEHKGYNHCRQDGCTNRVVKGGVCVRHGAVVKRKTCSHDGCTNYVIQGGVCQRHGAIVKNKICSMEGCANQVKSGGVCIKHGAIVRTCNHEGCTKQAQKGGVCTKHGAKRYEYTCKHDGCTNITQKGGFCRGHYRLLNGEA